MTTRINIDLTERLTASEWKYFMEQAELSNCSIEEYIMDVICPQRDSHEDRLSDISNCRNEVTLGQAGTCEGENDTKSSGDS